MPPREYNNWNSKGSCQRIVFRKIEGFTPSGTLSVKEDQLMHKVEQRTGYGAKGV